MRLGAGAEAVRVARWKDDPKVALLTPVPGRPPPLRTDLERSLDALSADGYEVVLTGAIDAFQQGAYIAAGFEEHARLHVLGRPLDDLPAVPREIPLRRARRRDRPEVHRVDRSAFSRFWQLGEAGLDEAVRATPEARFRLVGNGAISAYAVAGRAGRHGYIQRLAVQPDRRRAGLGRALVLDGLAWMRRRGAYDAVVNTQVDNGAALALYEHLGFRRRGSGLRVMRRTLA